MDVWATQEHTPPPKTANDLIRAASNGDLEAVESLVDSSDINSTDESGSTALIYASCFGHDAIVDVLLNAGADVDEKDKHGWTALMWAINNGHASIVDKLADRGASLDATSSTGTSARDFVVPGSAIHQTLAHRGLIDENMTHTPTTASRETFEAPGTGETDFMSREHELTFNDMMSGLDLGQDPAADESFDSLADSSINTEEFNWSKCLPHQMLVFSDSSVPKLLDAAITNIVPQRSVSQKPLPANAIFLAARYAHYFASAETLDNLLTPALKRIESVINSHKEDTAYLAFWMSNCSLLLYYLRKDNGLFEATILFQQQLSEILTNTYLLITQDVERRLDRVLDSAILDYSDIPGLDEVHYQKEWRIFRGKQKHQTHEEEMKQVLLPPSMEKMAKPSPRSVTSILSSALVIFDMYEVHPVISQQIMSQLFYWLGTVLFNRVVDNRHYLARSKAMQIRLNVSAIEDWTRTNNRRPSDRSEFNDNNKHDYESLSELCRRHFAPLTQMLQWLQCFTGFGDDFTNVVATLQQLKALNPLQLLEVANKYRPEVGEKGLSKEYKAYLKELLAAYRKRATTPKPAKGGSSPPPPQEPSGAVSEAKQEAMSHLGSSDASQEGDKGHTDGNEATKNEDAVNDKPDKAKIDSNTLADGNAAAPEFPDEQDSGEPELLLDASHVLPFVIPTLREMIITWGAGLGGTHVNRARKYEPQLPADFLDKFESDVGAHDNSMYADVALPQPSVHKTWGDDLAEEEMYTWT